MYIKTNDYVKEFFTKLLNEDNFKKLEFMIYVVDFIKNDMVNEKNEVNVNLVDEEINVFNFKTVGYLNNEEDNLIVYLLSVFYKEIGVSIICDSSIKL